MEQTVLQKRETAIALWFRMWLEKKDLGIMDIFHEDAVYIESWGPEYHGSQKILHWFEEWNHRGTVLTWDIRQYFHKGAQTVVEWYFQCRMDDGTIQSFDGISLTAWSPDGKIRFLKEYGCNENRYDPYQEGPAPQFISQQALWF